MASPPPGRAPERSDGLSSPGARRHVSGHTLTDDTGSSAPNCLSGSGACTLRGALAAGSPGDTITFSTTGTILLANRSLTLTKQVTIQGPGAALLAVDGQNAVAVFTVNNGVQATLASLTIQHGNGATNGGGISNEGNGAVAVSNSMLRNNSATSAGGAIANSGAVMVSNSMLSGNSATRGGAIDNFAGTLTVSNSTLSGNSAPGLEGGGGIHDGGTLTVSNSTLSGNSAPGGTGGGIHTANTLTVSNARSVTIPRAKAAASITAASPSP